MPISDGTIKELIEKGDLVITPFNKDSIAPASIDLRLGSGFLVVDHHQMKSLSLDEPVKYRKIERDSVILPPHHFLLATTLEKIKLPDYISGKVEGRSSVGRMGLFIQNAGWIDPGFEGDITLELYNANELPIEIKAGRRICQIVLSYTDKAVEKPYEGKYKGQSGTMGSMIHTDRELHREEKIAESEKMMIIGLTGSLGAGKGVVSDYLKGKGFERYVFSDILRDYANQNGIPQTREKLQDIGDKLRGQRGLNFLAELLYEKIKISGKKKIVVDGIRNPGEIEFFRKIEGFCLIAVDAPKEKRFKLLVARERLGDPLSWEEFLKLDARDKGIDQEESGQAVGKCINLADFILINDGELDEVISRLEKFYVGIAEPL
jgi:dCTP deaminase